MLKLTTSYHRALSVWTFLVAQMVKNLPAMQETQVRTLGQEDSPGEMNGYLLQCACLENPRDGAWWAAVCGVAQLDTTEAT